MQILHHRHPLLKSAVVNLATLFSLWFIGCLFGLLVYRFNEALFSALMRSAINSSVSIVGLSCIIFLPLLITAFAVKFSKPHILLFTCFLKGLLYFLCVLSAHGAFGSAGWLAQMILMFSDNCAVVLLWVLWLRYCLRRGACFRSLMILAFCVCVLVVGMDIFFVSPLSVSLLN